MMSAKAWSSSAPSVGQEDPAAGALGHEVQGVLAADIAAGVVGDRHDHDRIDHGVGQLRRFERRRGSRRVLVVSPPSVTTTITLRPWRGSRARCARQIDRVVQRRAGLAVQQLRARARATRRLRVKWLLFADLVVEGVERQRVLGIALGEQRVQEARRRIGLVLQFLGGGAAGVDQQRRPRAAARSGARRRRSPAARRCRGSRSRLSRACRPARRRCSSRWPGRAPG